MKNAMLHVHSLDDADLILKNLSNGYEKLTETIPLACAMGRILAKDLVAREDLPPFDRSAVDGFAVVSRDTVGASAALPALLRLAGEVKMGERAQCSVQQGTCAAVWTGGELPQGADAMVMLEEAQTIPGGMIAAEAAVSPGRQIVFRGDDVRAGEIALPAGRRIHAREIGLLAALGMSRLEVCARPRVKILSTGDELVCPDTQPKDGQLRDANGWMLLSACLEAGADAELCGIVPDDEAALRDAIARASTGCDLLLLSGASSAGAKDSAPRCLAALGEVAFHGLALKPGKPTFAGKIGRTLVIGLPGHPAAAYLVFHALVQPLLASLTGELQAKRTVTAVLAQSAPSNHGREELLPVRLLAEGGAEPIAFKSGLITPLCRADGYIRIPRDTEGLPKGATVEVTLLA